LIDIAEESRTYTLYGEHFPHLSALFYMQVAILLRKNSTKIYQKMQRRRGIRSFE